MNKILGYINTKGKVFKSNKKLSKKQGVVMAEAILMIAISLVLVITYFYPTFRNIIEQTVASIANWYTSALATLNIN